MAKDARFDGRFFTAVFTTGIFCRPICPAPVPNADNVRYFPSAAAAFEAGFRSCLRCRPEAAPTSIEWQGKAGVVARAQALIHAGFLQQHSVAQLAQQFALGERQLGRLFQQQLGASPQAVANVQRLLFAKQLLDETGLNMTQVAQAAGFNSLRRFNDAFVKTYGKPPSELRRKQVTVSQHVQLLLPYREPLDWPALLGWLRERAIPGVERVDDNSYQRSICLNQRSGWLRVEKAAQQSALRLTLAFADVSQLQVIVARVRRLFDLDANMDVIHQHLAQDASLQPLLDKRPGLRLPGAFEPFEFAVRAILGQQISVKAATTIAGRIAAGFGTPLDESESQLTWVFPDAARLAQADLSGIGLTGKRMATLNGLAQSVLDGRVVLGSEQALDAQVTQLVALPGIGDWTANYIAMRGLSEPDAFPAADLGLMKALGTKSVTDIKRRAEAWRPWRAYAAMHLWTSLGD